MRLWASAMVPLMAHWGVPDMRHAIGYALNWPERAPFGPVARLGPLRHGAIDIRGRPDPDRFPALRLARQVMDLRGHAGAVFNAAKEWRWMNSSLGDCGFLQMAELVDRTIDALLTDSRLTAPVCALETVQQMDHLARVTARDLAARLA